MQSTEISRSNTMERTDINNSKNYQLVSKELVSKKELSTIDIADHHEGQKHNENEHNENEHNATKHNDNSHEGHNHAEQTMTDGTHSTDTHQTEHKVDEQQELLGGLTDHYGFVWSNFHVFDLPFIIYDNGLHVYGSEKSLNESGLFQIVEHHGHKSIEKVGQPGSHPQLDLSITNFVFFQFVVMALLAIIFFKAKSGYKSKDKAPSGLQNALETVVLFVRDEVIRPNLPSIKIADKLTPYFMVLFFFIAGLNYIGMLPGGHTATSALEVTAAFAVTAFLAINFNAIRFGGVGNFFHHLLGGAPPAMAFLMVPLEVLGMFIKPFVLTLRLFANMTAGHLILTALIAVIIVSKTALAGIPIVPFSVFIMLLEVLVSFLQAFVFTMLTCIFTGLAIGDHPKEEWLDEGHSHSHAH